MPRRRPALHCFLAKETYEAWHLTAGELGVTTTALVEAIGQDLERVVNPRSPIGRAVIAKAREVDAERRRRADY